MREQAHSQRNDPPAASTHDTDDRGPGYLVPASGAFVGINEAKARLMLFCDKLPADKCACAAQTQPLV